MSEEQWRVSSPAEARGEGGSTGREGQRAGGPRHGLKDELKQSQDRILRSKSGRRASKTSDPLHRPAASDLIEQFNNYKQEYMQKKWQLQREMEGHVQRKDNQLSFMNKYSEANLENYFKRRKELLDLILAEQYTKTIISQPLERVRHEQGGQGEGAEQKIFTEFKIKTKFMKSRVRENILNALAEVKMKLLEENHLSNVKKLTEGNPDTLISLVHEKKRRHAKQRALTQRFEEIQRRTKSIHPSSSKPTGIRYPNALKTARPLVYQSGWTQQLQSSHKRALETRLFQSRVPNTPRK